MVHIFELHSKLKHQLVVPLLNAQMYPDFQRCTTYEYIVVQVLLLQIINTIRIYYIKFYYAILFCLLCYQNSWASQCRLIEVFCVCTEAKCEDLPLSVSCENYCPAYSIMSTFIGTGNCCATKGACTTYNKKEISADDSECYSFIEGCVSNGAGCMKSKFPCDILKTQVQYLQNFSLRPCIWINKTCSQYYN
ncbi:unnamed protein product (macronuclear) [Paramecium tetraurelia]|uniref:Uncharacterized protein n=1 Tax=Paramecium tetraurelia TaxID=5888 RepID=A0CUW0_PARTE|nr:uncharacterized protein GSPATT00039032001 [Paramecium tetraurelia]CAK74577.1 unnamed protein product [Paramecium tetraurelia]|eukprot:XP_001441974.1 hypothetical protein (macronuclear) [Paramecium tetraurelia strain d4-2]